MDQKGVLPRRLWLLPTWLDSDPMDWKGGREERHSVLGGEGGKTDRRRRRENGAKFGKRCCAESDGSQTAGTAELCTSNVKIFF